MALIKKNLATVLAVIVAVIAITAGVVNKVKPTLFMALPFPISIILWAECFGNEMAPYFMPDAWSDEEIKTWTKPGDLIVSVGAKQGTNWMLYCTHQIRMKASEDADDLFLDVNVATPWMDLRQSRHGSWQEQKDRYNTTIISSTGKQYNYYWDNPRYPFRIFKSHYAPKETDGGVLPITTNRQLKFLGMVRNGLDIANSLILFFNDTTDDFRNLFGGFPPKSPPGDTLEDTAHKRINELLPGNLLDFVYFEYAKRWWQMKEEPNVLLLHYADAKRDLKGTVKKLAKFVEVDLTDEEVDKVTERCHIDHMRTIKDKFGYIMPLNLDDSFDNEKSRILIPGAVVRDGYIDNTHKHPFTDKHREDWKNAEEKVFGEFDPNLLRWAREGGPFE